MRKLGYVDVNGARRGWNKMKPDCRVERAKIQGARYEIQYENEMFLDTS
jgi:hypothetical protein